MILKGAWRQRGSALGAAMAVVGLAGGLGWKYCIYMTAPRATLEQALHDADPAWSVTVTADKQELQIGRDHMDMQIRTARSGHLVVLQASTDDNKLELIFPNQLDKETAIPEGETNLPRPSWRLDATGPAGEGALLAVVTAQAPNIEAIRSAASSGCLRGLGENYGAALVTWRETEAKK
jgi:hypothetical protein